VGLSGQDLTGPGAGVDLEDFDNLGDMVLDGTRHVSLVTVVALTQSDVIGSIHDVQCVSTEVIREATGRDDPSTISIKREIYRRNPVCRVVIGG